MAPSKRKTVECCMDNIQELEVDVPLEREAMPPEKPTIWRPYADVLNKTSTPMHFQDSDISPLTNFGSSSPCRDYTFKPIVPARYKAERYCGNICDRSSERSISPESSSFGSSSRASSPDMRYSPCSTSSSEEHRQSSPLRNSSYSQTGKNTINKLALFLYLITIYNKCFNGTFLS